MVVGVWNPTIFYQFEGGRTRCDQPPVMIFENLGDALVSTGMFDEREKRVVFVFGVNGDSSFS